MFDPLSLHVGAQGAAVRIDLFGKPARLVGMGRHHDAAQAARKGWAVQARSDTRRPRLLDLTADHADCVDKKSIRAISDIRGWSAWAPQNGSGQNGAKLS